LPANVFRQGSEAMATEFKIDVHGESYNVAITGVGDVGGGKRKFYLSLDGMPEEVTFEALNEYVIASGGNDRKKATEPGHVSAPLPGNVFEIFVKEGDKVEAGQALLVMEAMKMETELLANISGTIKAVYVSNGDRVTPGETLIEIV
jgi:pyruvate carboxylase subunit B